MSKSISLTVVNLLRESTMTMPDDSNWKITACNLCNVNCGIKVQLGGANSEQFVKIKGDVNHPMSEGYICNKAARLDYYQNNTSRLHQPMRRNADGSYEAIDWDTAIKEIANKLNSVKQEHGGERIFYYGGGGQGNHLGGVYGAALRNALGVRYKANALSQEKTGLAWVLNRMIGGMIALDIEHADVVMFAGKNPFMSHGFQKARSFLRDIKKDPNRKLIVIDPRRTETCDYADIHLQVTPGRDAWCMSAIVGWLVQQNKLPMDWLNAHTTGIEKIIEHFKSIPVDEFAKFAGIEPSLIKQAANIIATANSFSLDEDLGVQMAPHSTLVTYLNFLSMLLTGNYGKKGTTLSIAQFVNIINTDLNPVDENGYEQDRKTLPVTGARIISGLFPGNFMAEEILSDHPEKPRALIVESSNPVHSLAEADKLRKAIRSLDISIAIDIAMTETAMVCDYVLPAHTQYEKWEGTFFSREFPHNFYHLRPPIIDKEKRNPFDGASNTIPEPEIHARIIDALGAVKPHQLYFLKLAAKCGLRIYTLAFMLQMILKPKWGGIATYLLYKTLGPSLPKGQEATAAVWGIAQIYARKHKVPLARTGIKGFFAGNKLFKRILSSPSGAIVGISEYEDSFNAIPYKDNKLQLVISELLDELKTLESMQPLITQDPSFPFTLAAGARTAYSANCAIRDPRWAKGKKVISMSLHPSDAAEYKIEEGDEVLLETKNGSAKVNVAFDERMHRGTLAIPNGQGMQFYDENNQQLASGVFANQLTAVNHRDKYIGTPLHKCVPARISLQRSA